MLSSVLISRSGGAQINDSREPQFLQLQKGANQNRGPPTLNRDEDPCWVWEDPHQLMQELPRTKATRFIIKNTIIIKF